MTNKDDQTSIDQANTTLHPTSTTEAEKRETATKTITTAEAAHMISCKEEHPNHAENSKQ